MRLYLPEGMEAWEELLSRFAPDIASALLPMVERLRRLIGPMPAERPREEGDPDGYQGVSRRGPVHRLLLSEWALADEFPEEFLRRAVQAEQGYLELAQRSPQGARCCAVCLDASPEVAGSPRIGQLAVLLVLWRRAEEAGAEFRWGVLGHPAIYQDISRESLRQLLTLRLPPPPGGRARAARAWIKAAGAEGGGAGGDEGAGMERWWVGGPGVADLPGRRIRLEDPLDPEPTSLLLHLDGADPVTLPVLDVPSSLRLMRGRGWGAVQVVAHRRTDGAWEPPQSVQWAGRSFRLLVRTDGTVREYMLERQQGYASNTGAESVTLAKYRAWSAPEGERIVACDVNAGRLIAVTTDPAQRCWLYGMGRPDGPGPGVPRWELRDVALRPPAFGRAAPLCLLRDGDTRIWLVDGGGAAWRITIGMEKEVGSCTAELAGTGIVDMIGAVGGPILLRRSRDGFFLEHHGRPTPERLPLPACDGAILQDVRDERGYLLALIRADAVASWSRSTNSPRDLDKGTARSTPRPHGKVGASAAAAGAAVVGVGQHNRLPMMLCRDRCLYWVGPTGQLWGMEASGDPIVRARLSGRERAAAWLDGAGRVTVCALNERGPAGEPLRLEDGPPPGAA